jgi:DNA-binding CsgD family transcriptional regulator
MKVISDLSEREKELDCLYEIAEILTNARSAGISVLLSQTADVLKKAMTYPEKTFLRISAGNTASGPPIPVENISSIYKSDALLETGGTLSVAAWYSDNFQFVEREKKLIKSAAALLSNAISTNDYYKKLEEKSEELASKNTALREILYQIGREKEDLISAARKGAGTLLLPLIGELEDTTLNERQSGLVRQLKYQLEALLISPDDNMKQLSAVLTPRELEICSIIKSGENTKETARLLNISPQTVERHRNTIRKKLGINRKGTNLVLYLRNLN